MIALELASSSHHFVYRDGARWLKCPRDGSDAAREELARDAAVHLALGRSVEPLADGGMILPHLGDPLDEAGYSISEVCGALHQLHAAPVEPDLLLSVNDWMAEAYVKVEQRLALHPQTAEWCYRTLDTLGPPPRTRAPGVVITDPHRGNWCRNAEGVLEPLDFETAVWGDLLVSLACLTHYAVTTRQPSAWANVYDEPAFRWYFTLKAVSAVSWLALDHSCRIPERIAALEGFPYWSVECP